MSYPDAPSFISQEYHKARQTRHACCECGEWITLGAEYRRTAGVWYGEFVVFHQCKTCADLFDMAARYYDEPIAFGELMEVVDDMVHDLGLAGR